MCPRTKSVGFALTQFSVGIATLLLCFAPLPPISPVTGVAQAQTIQQRQTEAERLLKQGNRQRRAREFTAALASYQQAIKIYQELKNPRGEMNALRGVSQVYLAQKNYPQAIEYAQKQLELARTMQDCDCEYAALSSLYKAYMETANYPKAIGTAERMVALAPKRKNADINEDLGALARAYAASGNQAKADEIRQRIPSNEHRDDQHEDTRTQGQNPQVAAAERLRKQGEQLHWQSRYDSAIQVYQQALEIYRSIRNRNKEAQVLENLGDAYRLQANYNQGSQRNYDQEIDAYQQALKIYRAIGNRQRERWVLFSLRSVYDRIQDLPKAIEYAEQELKLAQELREDTSVIIRALHSFYLLQANYAKAIEVAQYWLSLAQQSKDANKERWALEALVKTYAVMGDAAKSAEYQSQLAQRQQSGTDKPDEKRSTQIERYQRQLAEARKQRNQQAEMQAYEGLATEYRGLGDYGKAISYSESGLQIAKQINNHKAVLEFALKTGRYYSYLSDWKKALASFREGIEYHRQHPSREFAHKFARLLYGAGDVHKKLNNRTQALDFYQQAYVVCEQTDDPEERFVKHNDTGADTGGKSLADKLTELYIESGNYEKAIKTALAILNWRRKEAMNYMFERSALQYLGIAYQRSGNSGKATEIYEQLLAQSQLKGDRTSQIDALNGLASLKSAQNNPELAIVFYKQSVNAIETVRQDLRQLPKEQQEAYTRKVEDTYRRLADLLLSQGRVLEAQQVLELLKIQEIRNYTRNASAGEQTSGVGTNPTETQVVKTHGTLIAFGQKVADCEQSKCTQLSQLLDQREAISAEFNRAVNTLEQAVRKNRGTDLAFTDPTQLFGNPDQIVSAQPGTILLQTLVLPDKLWVLWASKGGVTKSIPVSVGQKQLSETVLKFRELLQNPNSNIQELQATGKQLYDWLIPTQLQAELTTNSIQHLVFSLDHVTRYIPMAALFDGKQYLTQRYTLSTIISTNTQMGNSPVLGVQNTSVLALGLSEAKAGFNPLPNVPTELDAIVRRPSSDGQGIYQGSEYLNSAFTWRTLRDNLSQHQILHIATHGKFEPGSADASFLVMGDGEKLPIPKIETLKNLGNLQLVALSACETALGGTGQDGTEIAGISYFFLKSGAKAVMASLWAVNDGSTSLLMQQFYKNLATSQQPITKAEALRQAQVSLLTKQVTAKDAPQRGDGYVAVEAKPGATLPSRGVSDFSHPYYWAPFILIGNSL
jgi:CHAT domain-containing protein